MMKVEIGHNVKVHYKGTFSDGTEFDNSRNRGSTLDFEVGSSRMLEGFTQAVIGMTEGETKTIVLGQNDAYGQINRDAFRNIPKADFGEGFVFEVGGMIKGNGPRGPFVARIHKILTDEVVLDFNHPLAGKELTFEIELVSIEAEEAPQMANWNTKMKKAELLEIARDQGLSVNTRSTKAQIIEALSA